ncbi:MAG: branched-chain amino acid transporter substrate-binding protein [Frankiales bacterium]|nr:branched-chain amino acid transporter substrate-binding protein [Frankiales bacterium]
MTRPTMTDRTDVIDQQQISGRTTSRIDRLLAARRPLGVLGWLVLLAFVAALPWLGVTPIWVRITVVTLIFGLISSGLNLTFGWAGEVSFAQIALFCFGAYVAAVWSNHGQHDILVLMVVAGAGAAVLGGLTALPGLRLGSWALAITSFLLVIIAPDVLIIFQKYTGGNDGLALPVPTLFGKAMSEHGFYLLCVVVAALWLAFFRNLATSRHGHALLILRESPVLASALGINIKMTKVLIYALAALPAGVAGVLFVFLDGYVSPPSFGLTATLGVIAASVIGGLRSLLGPFVATAFLMGLPIWSASLADYSPVISGVLLVVAGVLSVVFAQQGSVRRLLPRRLAAVFAGGRGAVADDPVGISGHELSDIDHDLTIEGARLTVNDVSVNFGGVKAVAGVSIVAEPGNITALIGPNGSGKTSLLNVISGFYRPSSGQVLVGSDDITRASIAGRSNKGVSRTFQTPLMPPYATVGEVVASGVYIKHYVGFVRAVLRTPAYRRALREDQATAHDVLKMLGIGNTEGRIASSLALGTRRLVELARVMASRPSIILLDEPASGLSPEEVGVMASVLTWLRDHGATIVLVEHNFRMIQSLADTIYVLDQGTLLASGSPAEIQANEDVARIYLGVDPSTLQAPVKLLADTGGSQRG